MAYTAATLFGALGGQMPSPAGAAVSATSTSGRATIGSGSWAVVATQSSSTPPPTGALVVTQTGNKVFYFQVYNDGTLAVTGVTYAVTINTANTTLALNACSVAWNQAGAGMCQGTNPPAWTTWIDGTHAGDVASGTAVSSSTAPAAVGSEIYLRAIPSGEPGPGTTFTINMTVTRSQARAAQTTNS